MVKKTPKNKFDDPAFRLQIVKWGATVLFLFVVLFSIRNKNTNGISDILKTITSFLESILFSLYYLIQHFPFY